MTISVFIIMMILLSDWRLWSSNYFGNSERIGPIISRKGISRSCPKIALPDCRRERERERRKAKAGRTLNRGAQRTLAKFHLYFFEVDHSIVHDDIIDIISDAAFK